MTPKKNVLRAAAATAVVLGAVSSVAPAPAVHAAAPIRIAVVGDSYTTGSNEGGNGPNTWTEQAWSLLAGQGVPIRADVAAEGGAGYGQRGNHGSVFYDLTMRAVRPNDVLVVFFGSRNDQPVNQAEYPRLAAGTLQYARLTARDARMLVIGPPWPDATPPPVVLKIRDSLRAEAKSVGATFVDPIAEGWFVGRPDLIGHDGVHPTDAGHLYMAEKIAPLIYRQLTVEV